ncbi:dimethylmenaquinone methyltransferase [Burkholderia ubonensis]|uniref:RraA family protein n=1 Tax=Burkholderia ubonensis TaxID=101571 RepID=UPI0007591FAD|nr:dimethylmenaquinone methyltransferase [Burkholderia ubonensis]KVZ90853.1 dimethylmenaquinone methyltransferase [Burkholderia ubonensis]
MSIDEIEKINRSRINTSTIADILDSLGVESLVPPSVQPLNQTEHYFAGIAYTVAWERVRKSGDIFESQPSTWEQVRRFLIPDVSDGTGLVYVAGAGPLLVDAALAGAMSCTYFSRLGFAGVVLGGAVRDIPELRKLPLPILATNPIPVDTQGAYRIRSTGEDCMIGNCSVKTGDLVVSDLSGTVVVPANLIATVIDKAFEIDELERSMLSMIREGANLPDLVQYRRRI